MDSTEAREHLEMADRIVAASTRDLCLTYGAPYFMIWGAFAALVDASAELAIHGALSQRFFLGIDITALGLAIVASAVFGAIGRSGKGSLSFVQREFLRAMGVTFALVFIAEFAPRLFPGFSASAIWTVACAIVLFFIALHGNRRALLCGLIVLASLFAANAVHGIEGYVLAAGLLVGYAGFGVLEMLAA